MRTSSVAARVAASASRTAVRASPARFGLPAAAARRRTAARHSSRARPPAMRSGTSAAPASAARIRSARPESGRDGSTRPKSARPKSTPDESTAPDESARDGSAREESAPPESDGTGRCAGAGTRQTPRRRRRRPRRHRRALAAHGVGLGDELAGTGHCGGVPGHHGHQAGRGGHRPPRPPLPPTEQAAAQPPRPGTPPACTPGTTGHRRTPGVPGFGGSARPVGVPLIAAPLPERPGARPSGWSTEHHGGYPMIKPAWLLTTEVTGAPPARRPTTAATGGSRRAGSQRQRPPSPNAAYAASTPHGVHGMRRGRGVCGVTGERRPAAAGCCRAAQRAGFRCVQPV